LPAATVDTQDKPILRQLDLFVLAIALPVFVLADFPMLGYAVAAGVWIAQRGIEWFLDRRVEAAIARGDRRAAMGTTGFSRLGRVWLIALAVLLVGLADREAGLAAAVLCAVLFTVHFGIQIIAHVFGPDNASPGPTGAGTPNAGAR
jgi:hypothetical protein